MPLRKLFAACIDHDRKGREEERERSFLENGGLVLEKLVASCNGRPIPIRTFSYEELILVTNNFDPQLILHEDCWYKFYKGSFEGRFVSIKSYVDSASIKDFALTDLAISAKLSSHKNILKLVGCCFETPNPTLVYEYAQNGVLVDQIYVTERRGTPMSWQGRLKIARQIAHAIAYLHTAFSRPIIHRDIKTRNILIDQHGIPKLSSFALSLSVPEDKTHVEVEPVGILGFLCPIYMATGKVTEKADVYSFGVVILELLTGQRCHDLSQLAKDNDENLVNYLRNHAMNEIADLGILTKEEVGVQQQLQATLQLALECKEDDPEKRPTMVEITKELRRIERFIM